MRNTKRKNGFKEIIKQHINSNLKEYLTVSIVFLIGIVLGIIFINYASTENQNEIGNYINQFIGSLKENNTIDKGALLKTSLQGNIMLGIILWFVGSTVIGIPLVYGIVGYRGFCLGYTISSCIAVLGSGKGILFSLTTVLFQNILFIPCVLALAVSGIKLYKSIMKDKRKENIKLEIYRHTLFSLLATALLVLSSIIEVYVSTNLLQYFIKYI